VERLELFLIRVEGGTTYIIISKRTKIKKRNLKFEKMKEESRKVFFNK